MTKRDEVRETLSKELAHRLEALSALRAASRTEPAPAPKPGPFVLGMIISSDHRVLAFEEGWVLAAAESGSEYAIWQYTVAEDGQVILSHADFYYRSVHGAADAAIKAAERYTHLVQLEKDKRKGLSL